VTAIGGNPPARGTHPKEQPVTYALRLNDAEIARYRHMAQAAHAREADMWDRAGIRPGAHVADIGCGPGAVLALLAKLTAPDGTVIGIDADPEAVRAANDAVSTAGARATARVAGADDTGLPPDTCDIVMLRHVLAHNGGREQAIVDHLAQLVRPGGHLYLVDIDMTTATFSRLSPGLTDLFNRYRHWHRAHGNDPSIGRRLAKLAEQAGLTIVQQRDWHQTYPLPPGFRGPAWAARTSLMADEFATAEEVDLWGRQFRDLDNEDERPTYHQLDFAVVCQRQ
jgi:SAM-dependent methyltransferase